MIKRNSLKGKKWLHILIPCRIKRALYTPLKDDDDDNLDPHQEDFQLTPHALKAQLMFSCRDGDC